MELSQGWRYFAGKTAVVTGAGSGIGAAIASYLGSAGATVWVTDRDTSAAERVAADIAHSDGTAVASGLDVTDGEAVSQCVTTVHAEHGRIDFMFNNAGISVLGEMKDMTDEHLRSVLEVNFWGTVNGCRAVYPLMIQQSSGHIINTASLAGLIPGLLNSGYAASKHALVGFSLSLRAEARQYGIRVTALCPGYIRTGIQAATPTVSAYLKRGRNRERDSKTRAPQASSCVPAMMSGIARNRAVVLEPKKAWIYWWMHRVAPGLVPWVFSRIVKSLKTVDEFAGDSR